MRRADRRIWSARPTIVSAHDHHHISARRSQVNREQYPGVSLEEIALVRPEVNPVIRGLLSVALELTLLLPRPMLEHMVLRLIDRLDELDGDPDIEPIDEREPELES